MSDHIADSRFWGALWKLYAVSPSIALCRVPELEYASTLSLSGRTLDHCCGDGLFASLAWPDSRFTAGCDMNETSLAGARALGRHERVDACDASKRLPYDDGTFDLVFDNSALEHILDLDAALREVARVTLPGGTFAFNVLNHRYFEWWPLDDEAMRGYREWQPFFHALTLTEWRDRLLGAGFEIEDVLGYFDKEASQELARLDCEFSGHFIRKRPSALVKEYNSMFGFKRGRWRQRLGQLTWRTEADTGAGYFITAKRQ